MKNIKRLVISVLYYKGPQYYHASYIVIVQESSESSAFECKDMHGLYRMAETCKKDVMIAQVHYPKNVTTSNPQACISHLHDFRVLEMTPVRYIWNQNAQL